MRRLTSWPKFVERNRDVKGRDPGTRRGLRFHNLSLPTYARRPISQISMEDGYLQLGSVRSVPIRLHWSTALGALFFSRFKFAPAFWLGFVLLVLVHEVGHAWVAQRLGHRALAIEVTGFGGLCKWDARAASGLHRSLVAWGGVFFQAILLGVAYAYASLTGPATSLYEAQLVSVFTDTNLFLIGLNLLPFPPLDGAQAWDIIHQLRRRSR